MQVQLTEFNTASICIIFISDIQSDDDLNIFFIGLNMLDYLMSELLPQNISNHSFNIWARIGG